MADNVKKTEPKTRKQANTLERRVAALHDILMQIYGPERLILRAGKLQALKYLRSEDLGLRTLALAKLVREDPSLNDIPTKKEVGPLLDELEDELADILARRTLEDDLEKRIAEKMQERHEDYVRDIRNQILKEDSGPETPETLKKFAQLVKLDQGGLTQSALEVMRPEKLDDVIGQDDAVDSLLAKLASPYPQHVLLYGPPWVNEKRSLCARSTKSCAESSF